MTGSRAIVVHVPLQVKVCLVAHQYNRHFIPTSDLVQQFIVYYFHHFKTATKIIVLDLLNEPSGNTTFSLT